MVLIVSIWNWTYMTFVIVYRSRKYPCPCKSTTGLVVNVVNESVGNFGHRVWAGYHAECSSLTWVCFLAKLSRFVISVPWCGEFVHGRKEGRRGKQHRLTPLRRVCPHPVPSTPTTRLIYSNSRASCCLLLVLHEEHGCVEDTRPGNLTYMASWHLTSS